MAGINAKDLEIMGWGLMATGGETPSNMDMLMDMLDRQYTARMLGLEAGLAGHVLGENPFMCSACKKQWAAGHAEGAARLAFIISRTGPTTVVLL